MHKKEMTKMTFNNQSIRKRLPHVLGMKCDCEPPKAAKQSLRRVIASGFALVVTCSTVLRGPHKYMQLLARAALLAFVILALWSIPHQAAGTPADTFTNYLPLIYKPAADLKSLVTKITVTLPQPLSGMGGSWCTWGYCAMSPRLYHEPLNDGRILLGWTDASGNGHVSLLSSSGSIEQTHNYPDRSVRGLVAHEDGKFAILLWDENA